MTTPFLELPDNLSVRAAAEWVGVSDDALYDEIRARRLRVKRVGRRIVVPKAWLLEWRDAPDPREVEAAGRMLGAAR